MAKPKHKRPSLIEEPKPSKTPKAIGIDIWSLNPAWRIKILEMQNPFGWHEIDEATLHYIRQKLSDFERMTLNEIFVVAKKQNHPVPVKGLCPEAQKRLEELKLFDVDEVYCLHLSGKERVWGIRDLNVLILLWWDPNHEVCPSEKKHT